MAVVTPVTLPSRMAALGRGCRHGLFRAWTRRTRSLLLFVPFSSQPRSVFFSFMTAPAATTTPLRRLAVASTTTCSQQASAYGKCILATYTDVKKDACKEEFAKFGACLREAVSGCAICKVCKVLILVAVEAQVVVRIASTHPINAMV